MNEVVLGLSPVAVQQLIHIKNRIMINVNVSVKGILHAKRL